VGLADEGVEAQQLQRELEAAEASGTVLDEAKDVTGEPKE